MKIRIKLYGFIIVYFCYNMLFHDSLYCQNLRLDSPYSIQQLISGEKYQELVVSQFHIRYWVLQGIVSSIDLKAIQLRVKSNQKLQSYIEIEQVTRKKTIHKRGYKSWRIALYQNEGRISDSLHSNPEISEVSEGFGFLQVDACRHRVSYLVRVVLDFGPSYESIDFEKAALAVQFLMGNSASAQQTLFKYPSEKSSALAVILMRSTTLSPEFINFVDWKRNTPSNKFSVPVDKYYFSNTGVYTRVYIPSSRLTGGFVTMEYISPDLNRLYSVCVSLSKRRQSLEGY